MQLEGSASATASSFNAKLSELTASDAALSDQLRKLQPTLEKLSTESGAAAEAVATLEGKLEVCAMALQTML